MNNQDTRFANQYAIQWFPGHMAKTLRMMEQEIQHVDASLVLLDARIPLSSLNPEIERITARKPKLYALNKADLADPAARRAAEVAVEGRHVLGIARVAFAEIAVITVCHCIFLRLKCVLLLLRSFY